MEEFIEKFTEFREWLNDLPADNYSEAKLIEKIKNRFDELGLNDVF